MARSDTLKNQNDGGIAVKDGTSGTALQASGEVDAGDFSVSGALSFLSEVEAYEARGKTTTVRKTTRRYPTGSFTLHFKEFSESTVGTLLDLLNATAGTPFAARVSTGRVPGDVPFFDIVYTAAGITHGDATDHELILKDCHIVPDFGEGGPSTITCNFTCYGDVAGDISILAPS